MPTAELNAVGDRFASIPACLHSANFSSNGKVRGLLNVKRSVFRQKAEMDERWENYITAWRKAAKLTMEALGERCVPPVGKGMMSSYESGKRKPRQDTLEAIAKALETTPGQLLSGPPAKAMPAEVVDIWTRIPLDDREQAMRTLKSFAK